MVIAVDPRSRLLHLLYDHSALRLENTRGLPPLISEPPIIAASEPVHPSGKSWQDEWEQSWDATRQWYRTRTRDTPPESPPRHRIRDDAGREVLDDDERSRWFDEVAPVDLTAARTSPEHVCLDALVPAWRTGLETILVLPYRGEHAERLSLGTLLVSPATRRSPSAFRKALTAPPPTGALRR
ncbi:hypothetical protein CFK38_14275 [Brachybacterium vulturis]|uniref:Uncharacterized protein n=1 Tax=Brachybacterium vulturis TaxID=2017484 RepID=A0A291GRE8_9MICO|nr:hypothetical protein [Brachybacterium vulturis]ATG52556.1 hypothetical protein CFK38_14275 [Brachybacterium vulturis]